tara:strand:- start:133 stop:360 length:228 start_codon:yes stop_codon:yes gene_type:complete
MFLPLLKLIYPHCCKNIINVTYGCLLNTIHNLGRFSHQLSLGKFLIANLGAVFASCPYTPHRKGRSLYTGTNSRG